MEMNRFEINGQIKKAMEDVGYISATSIQEKAIPHILNGADIVARSQTGSGKTLAFGIPMVNGVDTSADVIQALVICPTRELALQVCDELRKVTKYLEKVKIVPVYGGTDIRRQIQAIKYGAKIVVGTPGRIMDHINRRTLKLNEIKTLVLDEADEMLNMGFKADIESILKSTPATRQTLMFSATFPDAIKAITKNYQSKPIMLEVGESNQSLSSIKQSFVYSSRSGKADDLLNIIKTKQPKIAIVFCNTIRMTEQLKNILTEHSFNVLALHGDMRQRERTQVMGVIKKQTNIFLVATDVAARGIDIDNIDYVFNYDLPNNVEYYLHRIGRTARAGKTGNAITIINSDEQLKDLKQFERTTKSAIEEIESVTYSGERKKNQDPKPQKSSTQTRGGFKSKNLAFGDRRTNNHRKSDTSRGSYRTKQNNRPKSDESNGSYRTSSNNNPKPRTTDFDYRNNNPQPDTSKGSYRTSPNNNPKPKSTNFSFRNNTPNPDTSRGADKTNQKNKQFKASNEKQRGSNKKSSPEFSKSQSPKKKDYKDNRKFDFRAKKK